MKSFRIALPSVLFLAACGGGGSSSDDSGIPVSTPVAITVDNAKAITAEAVDAALSIVEVAGVTSVTGVVTEEQDAAFDLAAFVLSQQGKIGSQLGTLTTDTVTGVVLPPTTENCQISGSTTITGEIESPELGPSTGDRINLDFNDCSEVEGIVLNGTQNISYESVEGDLESGILPFSSTLDIDSDFSVTVEGVTAEIDGSMSLTLDTQDAITLTWTFSGQSLTVTELGQAETLSNFETVQSLDTSTFSYSYESSGTLDSAEIGGTVDFLTLEPFQGSFQNNPDTGELLVTGAASSSVRLIVHDNINLTLEVDTDGDNVVDETIETTWDELANDAA